MSSKHVDIVFDGPPGPTAGRFVEVEDDTRRSISLGQWLQRDDGYWVLRIDALAVAEAKIEQLTLERDLARAAS